MRVQYTIPVGKRSMKFSYRPAPPHPLCSALEVWGEKLSQQPEGGPARNYPMSRLCLCPAFFTWVSGCEISAKPFICVKRGLSLSSSFSYYVSNFVPFIGSFIRLKFQQGLEEKWVVRHKYV